LCGFCKCSHINEYAALSKSPHALADGLMLGFEHPADFTQAWSLHPKKKREGTELCNKRISTDRVYPGSAGPPRVFHRRWWGEKN